MWELDQPTGDGAGTQRQARQQIDAGGDGSMCRNKSYFAIG
jgi:hypothetical protein